MLRYCTKALLVSVVVVWLLFILPSVIVIVIVIVIDIRARSLHNLQYSTVQYSKSLFKPRVWFPR